MAEIMQNALKVLYEDNHVIVVIKPPMMPTQADSSGDVDLLSSVKAYIKEKYNKPGEVYIGLVHRLDRPVGGVMVFARTSKAASRLSEQVRTHQLKKEYIAIVHGKMQKNAELVDYLKKDEKTNSTFVSDKNAKDAKEAVLNFELQAYDKEKDLSLVKIDLKTGRHHQIRVQMASRNHAIYGDVRYGNVNEKGGIKLFAHSLGFYHPTTKEYLEFGEKPDFEKNFNGVE